ncbi:MAG TPA: hypothetical protein VHB69_08655 [Mycobacteriales bacterium]|nr:hypothetical protein [Mycobacteriales bacterium]
MRNDPNPQSTLAACLGVPVAELRRALPYVWRQAPICVTGVPTGQHFDLETGVWFLAGDPAVAIVGVLPNSVVVCPSKGLQSHAEEIVYDISGIESHVCFPRRGPDLIGAVAAMVAMIAEQAYQPADHKG